MTSLAQQYILFAGTACDTSTRNYDGVPRFGADGVRIVSDAVIAKMVEALHLEIKAIKKKGGARTVEVRRGESRGSAGKLFLYAFQVTEDYGFRYLRDDSPIEVVAGKESLNGIVVSLSEGELVIAIDRDLGPRISFARIVSKDWFLVEQLKERLEALLAGQSSFNVEKADQVIGEVGHRSSYADYDEALASGGEELNAEQKTAIGKALGSDITYLWGPPGTGKTTVVARIVEGFYRAGRSVLVVSNTNMAVDTALLMIADRLAKCPDFPKGSVLRFGPAVKHELEQKYGDLVLIDRVVERLGADLREQKEALVVEKSELEAEAAELRRILQDLEQLAEVEEDLPQLRTALQEAVAQREAASSDLVILKEEIEEIRADLDRAVPMGPVLAFLSGLRISRLRAELDDAEELIQAGEEVLSATEVRIPELRQEIGDKTETVKRLKARLARTVRCAKCGTINSVAPSTHRQRPLCGRCRSRLALAGLDLDGKASRSKLHQKQARVEALAREIAEIEAQLNALRDDLVRSSRVLATTVYRTFLTGQVERVFDVVVIDEASMVPLPMAYYAAGLARQCVVVAGDFRQLPAIVISRDAEAQQWLKTDVFRKAKIAEAVARGESPDSLARLTLQYRMRPEICRLVTRIFYSDNPLETADSVLERGQDQFPLGDAALLYINTAPHNPWTARPIGIGNYSRYNVLHALLIANIVHRLEKEGYLTPAGISTLPVGVISPYGAQTRLIQQLLAERLNGSGGRLAATVHRFQGNERNTIILDIADSLGLRPSQFVYQVDKEKDGPRLLNVALSRASHRIILVANFDWLRKRLNRASVVREILDLFEKDGVALGIAGLLPLADWPPKPASVAVDTSATGFFTDVTFYPAFEKDLVCASGSIVIFSPFLTPRGTARWMDILRTKIRNGVRVRLVTKPLDEQRTVAGEEAQELIDGMRHLGIVVDLRARMHEKFAVVDDEVLWHGSLNMFSHNKASESMLRIPDRGACQQMARFVATGDPPVDLAARENPLCDKCGAPMVWRNGRFGVYFTCGSCGHKMNA